MKLMFVGATTENIEDTLLLTFRRRIPMIVHLPALKDWFLKERVELIYTISFQQECNRINAKIFIDKNVVEILAFKEFKGNIGQLKSMIQVLCSRFYEFSAEQAGRKDGLVSVEVAGILNLVDSFQDGALPNMNTLRSENT